VVTALIQLIIQAARYPHILGTESPAIATLVRLTPTWFFPTRIFWFAFGIVVGVHASQLTQLLSRIKWALLAATVVLIPVGVLEWEILLENSGQDWVGPIETAVDSIYAFAFLLTFFAFNRARYPFTKELSDLGPKSFGIYLIHDPVLRYASKAIFHIAPWILAYQLLFQPILIVLGLGIPLLLMAVVNRSPARKEYAYLFG
jgi:surface polysaccharide O-acyltransferase-like enzyme